MDSLRLARSVIAQNLNVLRRSHARVLSEHVVGEVEPVGGDSDVGIALRKRFRHSSARGVQAIPATVVFIVQLP